MGLRGRLLLRVEVLPHRDAGTTALGDLAGGVGIAVDRATALAQVAISRTHLHDGGRVTPVLFVHVGPHLLLSRRAGRLLLLHCHRDRAGKAVVLVVQVRGRGEVLDVSIGFRSVDSSHGVRAGLYGRIEFAIIHLARKGIVMVCLIDLEHEL